MSSCDDVVVDIKRLLKAVQASPSSYKALIVKNLTDLINGIDAMPAGKDKDRHVYAVSVGLSRMIDEIDYEVKDDPNVSKLLNSIVYRSAVRLQTTP